MAMPEMRRDAAQAADDQTRVDTRATRGGPPAGVDPPRAERDGPGRDDRARGYRSGSGFESTSQYGLTGYGDRGVGTPESSWADPGVRIDRRRGVLLAPPAWSDPSPAGVGPRGPRRQFAAPEPDRSDERILDDVCLRIHRDVHVDASEVSVEIRAGIVTLTGTVPERFMKHQIEDLADGVAGVKDIDNRLTVSGHAAGR